MHQNGCRRHQLHHIFYSHATHASSGENAHFLKLHFRLGEKNRERGNRLSLLYFIFLAVVVHYCNLFVKSIGIQKCINKLSCLFALFLPERNNYSSWSKQIQTQHQRSLSFLFPVDGSDLSPLTSVLLWAWNTQKHHNLSDCIVELSCYLDLHPYKCYKRKRRNEKGKIWWNWSFYVFFTFAFFLLSIVIFDMFVDWIVFSHSTRWYDYYCMHIKVKKVTFFLSTYIFGESVSLPDWEHSWNTNTERKIYL